MTAPVMLSADTLARAEALLARLRTGGLSVATAESCTGGLIAAALTAVPGSSASVLGGLVTYSDAAKEALLGVPRALLDAVGAVSAEVARAMAEGAVARTGANLAVSATGIAGPGGETPGKPVGLVFLGVVRHGATARSERFVFSGDRAAVREATVREALRLLDEAAA